MFFRVVPLSLVAFVGLAGCQAYPAGHLPTTPIVREVVPDTDAYRHFRAELGVAGGVTLCALDGVGGVPTYA